MLLPKRKTLLRELIAPSGPARADMPSSDAQRLFIVILSGILIADGKQQLHVVDRVGIMLTLNNLLFMSKKLVHCKRFTHRSDVRQDEFI